MKFDEDGNHYFVSSDGVGPAEGFNFVSSAHVNQDDLEERILYVTFSDGYLADFASKDVAGELDDYLIELDGVEDVFWEDREYFQICYEENTDLAELIKNLDQKVKDLSKV